VDACSDLSENVEIAEREKIGEKSLNSNPGTF
jgi:hypothetical protein